MIIINYAKDEFVRFDKDGETTTIELMCIKDRSIIEIFLSEHAKYCAINSTTIFTDDIARAFLITSTNLIDLIETIVLQYNKNGGESTEPQQAVNSLLTFIHEKSDIVVIPFIE